MQTACSLNVGGTAHDFIECPDYTKDVGQTYQLFYTLEASGDQVRVLRGAGMPC